MNTQFEEIAKQEQKYHEWKRIQKQVEVFRMAVMNHNNEEEELREKITEIKASLEKEFPAYPKQINLIINECNLIMYSKKTKHNLI